MKRVLVINTTRMGDLVQSSPLLQGLSEDGWEVTLLYSENFRAVVDLLPGVTRAIPLPLNAMVLPLLSKGGRLGEVYNRISALTAELEQYQFDLVANISHTDYSAPLTRLARASQVEGICFDSQGQRLIKGAWADYYFNSILNRGSNCFNLVDINRLTGGVERSTPVKLNIPVEAVERAEKLADEFARLPGEYLVGIVPGASTVEKRWPAASFAEAVRIASQRLRLRPVILASEGEAELAETLASNLPEAANLCGKTDVATLAATIAKLDLLITNDTGPMHIAAAVGTWVIDVTLGSAMAFETAPYGVGHYVIESRVGCFPCLPSMKCSHFSCQKSIPSDAVAALICSALTGDDPQIPSGVDANIYRTEKDQDGFQTLRPLVRRPLSRSIVIRTALRELWKRTLCDRPVWDFAALRMTEQIGAELYRDYLPPVSGLGFGAFNKEVLELGDSAGQGRDAAMEVADLAGDMTQINRIKEAGKFLWEIDAAVARIAFAHPDLKPLVAQFNYAKQALENAPLAELASRTAEVYRQLYDWCTALPKWLEGLNNAFEKSAGRAIEAA